MFRKYRKTKTLICISVAVILYTCILIYTNDSVDHLETLDYEEKHWKECKEKQNFVYLKMIKCASETLTHLFHRFGYFRNLTFVLPLDNRIYIGWPYSILESYFRPSKTGEFNILCEHFVFNETTLKKIMPSSTVYLTSIREPFSQFKSTFNYYNIGNLSGLDNGVDSISRFLKNVDKYEAVYQSNANSGRRYCVPEKFSMTRNLMSYNLGMPLGFPPGSPDMSQNWTYIKQYMKHLDKVFSLVMIVEYMEESLILLKRIMCWKNFKSILYISKNIGKYSYKTYQNAEDVVLYKKRSSIDYYLYDYFNQTLWRKIKQEPHFWEEVAEYRKILNKFNVYCTNKADGDKEIQFFEISGSAWTLPFYMSKDDCDFANYESEWFKILKKQYDRLRKNVTMPKKVPYFC